MESRDRREDVRRLVAAHLPGCRVDSVVYLGSGLDNTAYEVNGELIVRFSQAPDSSERAARVDREARVLNAVASVSPVAVPAARFTDGEQGCLAYLRVPGVPLLDLPAAQRWEHGPSIGAALGALLSALHAMPRAVASQLVDTDNQSLTGWLLDAEAIYWTLVDSVPPVHRQPIQTFLNTLSPDDGDALVFSHNDLGIEHVLVEPDTWTVTGVIDWSDAALVDPAYDFGLVYRDLGPPALEAALRAYLTERKALAQLGERAVFYARCSVFEALAHGLQTGNARYAESSMLALEWLFPP